MSRIAEFAEIGLNDAISRTAGINIESSSRAIEKSSGSGSGGGADDHNFEIWIFVENVAADRIRRIELTGLASN